MFSPSDDFKITFKGRRFLKDSVVPSKFQFKRPVLERKSTVRQPDTQADIPVVYSPTLLTEHNEESKTDSNLINESQALIKDLQSKVACLEKKLQLVTNERDHTREVLRNKSTEAERSCANFCIERFEGSDSDICFYTGFPTMKALDCCYSLLNPENNIYYRSTHGERKKLKDTKLSYKNQFFMTLVRLRLGLLEKDIADRFNLSQPTVHRYFHAWLTFMYLRLGSINIWPSQEAIRNTMPESMKSKFPKLEWILDAFEIQTQMPGSLVLQSQSYSSYKSRNTVKGLVACTPSGQVGFISQLYTGSISDRELVIRSGFLQMPHNPGAVWLVDKGFQIQDLADKLDVTVNMPAFVGKKGKLTESEVFQTQSAFILKEPSTRLRNFTSSIDQFQYPPWERSIKPGLYPPC